MAVAFPLHGLRALTPLCGRWYQTGGKGGQELPAEIRELMEIYDRLLTCVSQEKTKELFGKIIAANERNLWVIGLVHEPPDYYVATTNFHNLPKKDFQSWIYPNPGPVHPEQFFHDSEIKLSMSSGILINNGSAPRSEGERLAAVEGGMKRVRPALMSTATVMLALIPVLTSLGKGSGCCGPYGIAMLRANGH